VVAKTIVLDAGPLGLATNPRMSPQSATCLRWIQTALSSGHRVIVPEIADYEVRRELLRAEKYAGLARLDALAQEIECLPITTVAMRVAAQLWAQTRQRGKPTADDRALDGDVILAAQVLTSEYPEAVIATTNVGHLSLFVEAMLWTNFDAGETP
jgi:predicted nucleic acid-binding protein